jgi:signal peptidase I
MDPKEELWLEGLRQGRPMRFRPLGYSMAPMLRHGDVVTIVAGPGRIGDIVLIKLGGDMVLHRLVATRGDTVFTKGDALPHLDQPGARQDILGQACRRERNGKILHLDSTLARLAGLAFCLTLSFFPGVMAALGKLKRLVQPAGSIQAAN